MCVADMHTWQIIIDLDPIKFHELESNVWKRGIEWQSLLCYEDLLPLNDFGFLELGNVISYLLKRVFEYSTQLRYDVC